MSLERRWVARCDEAGCAATLVVPPATDSIFGDDRGNAGVYICDEGWDARPNRREVYCPRHLRTEGER